MACAVPIPAQAVLWLVQGQLPNARTPCLRVRTAAGDEHRGHASSMGRRLSVGQLPARACQAALLKGGAAGDVDEQ
eukprot:131162-Alexandrium_andersonii.AAC.1